MEPLQEIELISLAEDIVPGKYSKLCNALGYSYAVSQSHIVKHLNNVNEALVELLIKWNINQGDSTQTRSILASKLHELRLGELGERLSEGKYLPNQQDLHDHKKTPVQTCPGMAAHGGIADNLLFKLAEDIETGEQMEALGRTLGFKVADINRYTETNRIEGRVTCKGTRDMLFDWRQTVEPCDQHIRLKQALIDAELVMLASTYLKRTSIIPDISSKQITPSLTVQQCREKLKNKYLNQLCKIPMKPWDQNDYAEFKDMHTVVTMVKKDARGQDMYKKEKLQGSVAKIFSTKVNGSLPARILISAPAGRGKTTAVAKMAYDWVHREKGSALEHLPLLFVVKFRNTSKRTSIGEAIKDQLLSDVDDLTPEGLENFIRENQGICHIILDGLDEYAGISSSNRSSESNMVSVIRWEEFPECRVLVTTRPHLENFFDKDDLPTVYTKMWIEGFSQESSREYIDKFFAPTSNSHRGHGDGLKVYLDDQPLINELVKTPLFCLMICHLWSEELLDTKTATQTKLLDSLNAFLMHHANARSKSKVERITDENLGEIIRKLGKVALAGLLDDSKKLVFTPHDFRRVPSILDRACELGILSKMTVTTTRLQQSHKITSINIEFYHKLAQEHSAGKYLAAKAKSRKRKWPWQTSNLDRVLLKINANIGDYENLIRFAAGTDNSLCIRIMEALLSNSYLDESERYRIILDCSSETKGTEENVSSFVERCVTAQSIVLKSPTVYTVVGMQNLPQQMKHEVRTITFEGSTLTTDVTSGLWSCLGSFSMLHTLTISDSSLSFPPSAPELPSVTKLAAERVTSQSYEGLISSLPGLRDIDITIDDAERDISQITACLRRTGGQQLTRIELTAPSSLPSEKNRVSRETVRGLGLLIRDQTKELQRLCLSGVKGLDEEDLVELVESSTLKALDSLHLQSLDGRCFEYDRESGFWLKKCRLSTEMTARMWSCLRSFTSLNHLSISDSSLSFPPSPPELPSVTELLTESVTSQSYEGLLSSLPGLIRIDISIDDAERDIPQITAGLRRTRGQQLTHIDLTAPSSLPSEMQSVSSETMRGLGLLIREQTKNLQWLCLSRVKGTDEGDLVELVECCKHVKMMNHLMLLGCGTKSDGRLRHHITGLNKSEKSLRVIALHDNGQLFVEKCQLSTEMTVRLWSCLRSFTSLDHLTISDSSLSFPPSPPELPSVTKLSAERVTSQSYEGLLSSLPGLRDIDITIDDAERDIPHITACLRRTGGQQLTHIELSAPYSLPSEKNRVSRETMRGLGLLIRDQTKNLKRLRLAWVKCLDEEYLVELVESSTYLKALDSLHLQSLDSGCFNYDRQSGVKVEKCRLSTEMTEKSWSCLRSFTSLNHLTISDSSLSFPPSPPDLPSVTKLSADRVTSQCYEGLLSSLPGLRDIDITIDDAERDIPQITACLRRTGRQQLTHIELSAPYTNSNSPLSEKQSVSRETMRGLGLLIREKTKNLQWLRLNDVKCTDEEDLVYLIECCRNVKTMSELMLQMCGTREGGRLYTHLQGQLCLPGNHILVKLAHDYAPTYQVYFISRTD